MRPAKSWIWQKKPRFPLGRYGGARVWVRKLNRLRDIELVEVSYQGQTLRVAAPGELVRMKALAVLARNLTRDYVDLVALDSGLREAGNSAASAIVVFDDYYREHKSAGSLAREVVAALADPRPREEDPQATLNELVGLRADLRDWNEIRLRCQRIAADIE
ncbi:MAG: nucleotidyl transferase AbiEii/AbiGii toxin family protein [Nocardia sp.]|nr:nucleotidyl transferase AbiEii/AbiGii toxin family protein [Nocardia sp.]